MIKYQTVLIRINVMTEAPKTVPAWEVPVLKAVHGDLVNVVDESVLIDKEAPHPRAEAERLISIYGVNPEERRTYLELAYGHAGQRGLEKAIEDAVVSTAKKRGRPSSTDAQEQEQQ